MRLQLLPKLRPTARIVALCSAANFIHSADRTLMPIAIVPMGQEFGWSLSVRGWILSAMLFGYLTSQVVGSPAAGSRFGGKRVLTFAVSLWSLTTIATPLVADDVRSLILMRILLGVGEGLCLPTIFTLFADRIPVHERSRSFAYLIAAGTMGQTVAALICPHIYWQTSFYTFGALGLLWVLVWIAEYGEELTDRSSSSDSPSADAIPLVAPAPNQRTKFVPYMRYVSLWPLWAIYTAHFAMNWTTYIIMHWLPTYLVHSLGADPQSMSLTALPYLVNSVSGVAAGHWADSLIEKNWSLLSVRRLMTALGLVLPAFFLMLFCAVNSLLPAILFISLSMGTIACNTAGHLSNHADVAPANAGITFAVSNTLATIPGILAGPLTADLVTQSHGRWSPVFMLAAVIDLTAAVVYVSQASANAVL